MAIASPPQHRADAEPVFVLIEDDAWDQAKINEELEEAEAENKRREEKSSDGQFEAIDLQDHPYLKYISGRTRYDIDAPCIWRGRQRTASEYFEGEPTKFVLRRLNWRQYYRVRSAIATDENGGFLLACRIGLHRIDGDSKFRVNPDLDERSSDEMRKLFELKPEIPLSIGRAVWVAAQPLSDSEKKASAS